MRGGCTQASPDCLDVCEGDWLHGEKQVRGARSSVCGTVQGFVIKYVQRAGCYLSTAVLFCLFLSCF